MVKASGLNARVAWVSGKTLAKYVIRSALESPPCPAGCKRCNTCEAGLAGRCHIKNVVYKITCNLCSENPATYIGESKRRVRDRFNEHLRDAKNQTKNTPLGDHIALKHPSSIINSTSLKISIQGICKDVADLKIAESVEIRNQRPTLNTQTASWPLLNPPSSGADPGKLQGEGHESKWCPLPIPKIKNSSDFGHLILVVPYFQFFYFYFIF